jgi:hypothetical protein
MNSLPGSKDGTCRTERLSHVEVAQNLKANHTFGFPVYALNGMLASDKTIPKWDSRARVGLYVGTSPRHAINVSLVLSLDTGLMSPKFHVQHDDFFETVSPKASNPLILSHWQTLSGIRLDGKPEKIKPRNSRGSKSVTNKAGVIPTVFAESDLFEMEGEVPPMF